MKVTQKKIGPNKVRLDVVATVDEVANALHTAQVAFVHSMGLQLVGGKTPAQVAEERMGVKNLDSIVAGEAVKALVPFALDKKNLVPLFLPEAHPKSPFERGRQFSFSLEVTLKPKFELSSYEPVEFNAPAFTWDESLVDERLKEMASTYTSYQSAAEKPVEAGDSCLLAMECFQNGERLPGLSTDGRTYVVGEGYMPEGFDQGILGMKPGETRSFSFEGPDLDDDFNPIIQKVDCTVTLKEIQQAVAPELNDEWVQKSMPWYKSFEDLRNDVAQGIERQARAQYDSYLCQLAAKALSKRFEGSIPDEVYEAARTNLMDSIRMNLQQQGKTWDDFVKENGGDQQVGMMVMLQTRELLVQGFTLDAVYRHEKLTITDADIEEACASLNSQMSPKQVRRQFEKNGQFFSLRESAERIKANKWVVEHAKINVVEQDA